MVLAKRLAPAAEANCVRRNKVHWKKSVSAETAIITKTTGVILFAVVFLFGAAISLAQRRPRARDVGITVSPFELPVVPELRVN